MAAIPVSRGKMRANAYDVELVAVGKDHKILEVLRVGSGIVDIAVRAANNPARAARNMASGCRVPGGQHAIDDRIIDGAEIGRVEKVAQRLGRELADRLKR